MTEKNVFFQRNKIGIKMVSYFQNNMKQNILKIEWKAIKKQSHIIENRSKVILLVDIWRIKRLFDGFTSQRHMTFNIICGSQFSNQEYVGIWIKWSIQTSTNIMIPF